MPVTCGRTSATRKAVVRPGSSSVMSTLRGAIVTTPTSGGGGGPASCLPHAASNDAAVAATRISSFLLGIARSVHQHATEEVVQLVQFFLLEAVQVDVHPFDHDRPDLRGHLPALRREVQVDDAAVGLAALAAQKVLFLEAVEHAAHGREADLAVAREPGHGVRALEPQHEHRLPLHPGEL